MWTRQQIWKRAGGWLALACGGALLSGCAATSVISFAYEQANEGQCISAGCAAKAVLVHVIDKATEGEPTPCHKLNSVERALSQRCGPYQPGSLLTKDVTASGLPRCPLTLAARDVSNWRVLPELISKGATPEQCDLPPLVALAHASACPDFKSASPDAMQSLRWLAVADARAIHHDVVRMLSCPGAREAGLHTVLDNWLAQGQLPSRGLAFGALGALHPSYINSPFARSLEAQGHTARAGLGAYAGQLPSGFDLALKDADRPALDWWFSRVPDLVNRVPPRQGNQFAWTPLARVITPTYLARPEDQSEMVHYLLSRGADPWKALPHDPGQTVVSYARKLKSPSLDLLDPPVAIVRKRSEGVNAAAAVGAGAGPALALP